jgi:hypothetical protein
VKVQTLLQKMKPVETPPIDTQAVATASPVEDCMAGERSGHDQDAALAELTACIEAGVSRNQRRSRTVHKIKSLFAFLTFVCLFSLSRGIAAMIGWGLLACLLNELFVERTVLGIGFSLWAHRTRHAERAAVRQLAAMDDARSISALIDILYWTNDEGAPEDAARPEAWEALGRLLPKLTEQEIQQLGGWHQGILAGWMESWDNPFVQKRLGRPENLPLLGILHVMTCTGQNTVKTPHRVLKTVTLLPVLEKWAAGKEAGQDAAVQQAAILCRESIQQKMALARHGEQLLRGSAPPPESPSGLLRPVQDAPQTDPQELLRPDSSESVSTDQR